MDAEPAELARRAVAGDREALTELWRRHRGWLAAVMLAHRPAGSDLDDLLQDLGMAIVRNIGTLRSPENLRPWLRAIALNVVRSRLRRRASNEGSPNGRVEPLGDRTECDPRDVSAGAAARTALDRALAVVQGLPVHYREPLLLRSVRDLSTRHIAEALELPIKTVETRLARARRMVWEALAADNALEPGRGREPKRERP